MLKKNLYTCLLLAAVLLLAKLSFGQQNVLADFNLLPGGVNTPGGSAVTLCPSVSSESVFSISTFSVPLNSEGLSTGNPRFEWVVFGGAIVDANGSVPTNEAYAPQNVGGVTYYYISSDNFSLPSAESTIQVQWDDADVPAAWVAVRQVSEWGCSAGPWSVYTNIIANTQPTFTSFPPAIRIAYDERVGFELPDPQAFSSDDGCPRPLTYSYSVLLPSSTLLTGDRTNLTLTSDLEVGNNTVTYRIFDGLKFSEQSYIITVDPQPTIEHVAWYNPVCPGGNGYVMVSDMQYNNNFPIEYSFNNGTTYGGASDIVATAGTTVSLRARVTYSVDMDFNGSVDVDEVTVQETPATAVCEVTLHDPETSAVDAVPVQGDVAVTIKNAECASDSNGYIFVEPTSMLPQNSSLTFNGSGSHLLLNKAYNAPLMQFSVAAWIKVPAGAVGNGAIVSFNNSNYYQLTISTPSGGINYVQFETGATPTYFAHSTPINDGKWHLVVATYNGGERTIYIDGKPESVGSVSGTPTGSGDAFGIIGARSTASTFGAAPAGNYFTGQMAAVGLYNSPLSQSEVDNLMLGSFAGAPSLWVFDETPDMVSSQAGIFSDFASLGSIPSEWARAVGLSYSSGNAPVIYNWTPDKAPADYDTELEELKQGAYQFTVKDIFNCTPQNETYTVGNDDQDPPQILVNVALGKDASQVSDASGACTYSADRAVDAYIDGNLANCNASATGSATDPWWQVDLGLVVRVKQIVVNFANGSSGDFVAMVTSGAYSGNLATDTVTSGIYNKLATLSGSTHTFNFDNNGRFIRIQRAGGSSATLELAEVEVLSPAGALYTLDFYLPNVATGDCNYTISAGYDASVNPVAADNCSGITNYSNSLPGNPSTVDGLVLNMDETQTITWKAIDDAPDSTSLDVEYTLLDTVKPWFIPADRHNGAFDTLTFCDVFPVLRYPVPNGQDNYYCPGNGDYKFTSLDLYIDNRLRYPNIAYDPFALDDTLDVDQAYLSNGPHTLVWRLTDYMNNSVADTMHLFIGERPLITGVRTAGITCGGTNDGIIYIYGTSTNASSSVLYYVTNGTDTIASGSPVFSSLEPGNYTAWIVADGCKSTDYGIVLNIADREPIAPYADILPVECFGDSGSIDITQYGTRNLLHLYGGTPGVITAPNYAALDLTATGTIEAFVFFDSISATVNNDAWIIGGNGYGIWLDNGTLTFFVNNTPVATAPGAIAQRTWYHVAGTWGPTSSTLYINSSAYSGSAASNAVSGGSLYIGCSGGGNTLAGIVRFARVWNSELTISQIQDNYRFEDPINYNNSLVANYPLNSDGGGSLANKMGAAASFAGGLFAWQPFAYYWLGVNQPYFKAAEDLVDVPAQDYHFYLSTPFGCNSDMVITLQMTDNNPPILNFYDTLGTVSTIDVDRTIYRVTGHTSAFGEPATPVNVAGDCWFAPFGGEFDPVIDDGACDASDVTVTWSYSSTNSPDASLNGVQFNDTTVVYWTAVDGAGTPAYKTMTYIVRDNEKPVLPADDTLSVDATLGFCYYLVPDSTALVPAPVADNCLGDGGYFRNNYNFDANLYHQQIPVGVHDIRWIYRDKWGNADTMFQHLTVVDVEGPNASCKDTTVYLDGNGEAFIDSSFINNGTTDYCGITSMALDQYTLDCADVLPSPYAPVVMTVTDINGVSSSCTAHVRVIDDMKPVIHPRTYTVSPDINGVVNLVGDSVIAYRDDNCGVADVWCVPNTLSCFPDGENMVMVHMRDVNGNEADPVPVGVIVQDTIAPEIQLKASIILPIGPDGYYEIDAESDIILSAHDNCTDPADLSYFVDPTVVYCDSIGYIGITVRVVDATGNTAYDTIFTAENRVLVVDNRPPDFSLDNFTLTIPSSGTGTVYFDNIIPDENVHDNCTPDSLLWRYIKYDKVGTSDWCGYGNEGGASGNAMTNIAGLATVTGTAARPGFPLANANDNNPPGSTITAGQTYYATGTLTGEGYLQYNFAKKYEFDAAEFLWASVPTADGNIALNPTYLTSTTPSGGTGTAGADAFTIEYKFNRPVVVANCSLRWTGASSLQSPSRIEYYNYATTSWVSYGTIENRNDGYATLVMGGAAADSITRIRLVYDPNVGNVPALTGWVVKGKTCTQLSKKVKVNLATSPGEVLVSHNWNYISSVSDGYSTDYNEQYCNDADEQTDGQRYFTIDESDNNGYVYVTYVFHFPITLSRTQVFWDWDPNGVPESAELQYLSGGSWLSAGNIPLVADQYNSLDLNEITTSSVRIYLRRADQWGWGYNPRNSYIYNWRVYGNPCETVSVPTVETISQTRRSATGVGGSNSSSTDIGRMYDGNIGSQYFVPQTYYNSNDHSQYHYVYYQFNTTQTITSTSIYWNNNYYPDNATVYVYTGSTFSTNPALWTSVGSIGLTGNNTENKIDVNKNADFIIIRFLPDYQGKNNFETRITEWSVSGYPASATTTIAGCWTTADSLYYTCSAVTTEFPVTPPTTATIEYSADNGTSWNTISSAVGTTAFAGSVNHLNFGSVIEANAFRLRFNNPEDTYIGAYEWRVFGRRMTQDGDTVNVPSACASYDCTNVNDTVTVYLKLVDLSGNFDSVAVQVPVVPYFDILTLDIKDCGYSGERYYPSTSGLDKANRTYSYTWDELDATRNYAGADLFNRGSADWECLYVTDAMLPYTETTRDWINISVSGCGFPPDGNYRVNLRITDDHGCWDNINYDFFYDQSESQATSIDTLEYCLNKEEFFRVNYPTPWSFWRQSSMEYTWTNLAAIIASGDVVRIEGGESVGDATYPKGRDFVKLRLKKVTTGPGTYTEIQYAYKSQGFTSTITSPVGSILEVPSGPDWNSGGTRVLVVLDSVAPGGPYLTADNASANQILTPGTRYVITDGNNWYGDYFACLETRVYRVNVLQVTSPVLQAFDKYNTAGGGWQPAASIQVCPRDTIWYRVSNYIPAQFAYLNWSWTSADAIPVATGRRLDQGNSYDDSIQIVWDIVTPGLKPRVTVKGFNALDCSSDAAFVEHTFSDVDPPVLGNSGDCSSLNVVHSNTAGLCDYNFQNLPPPLMDDNCRHRIADFWCEADTSGDGLSDFTGKNARGIYPLGVSTVTWFAKDYSNLVGHCTQTVTVNDEESPRFVGVLPTTLTLNLHSSSCDTLITGDIRKMLAWDNCDTVAQHLSYITVVDYQNDGIGLDTIRTDSCTISGHTFDLGETMVHYIVKDTSLFYNTKAIKPNSSTISFPVYVVDKSAPLFAEPTYSALPVIPANTNAGANFATITVPYPNKADPTVCSDNCGAIDSIYFIQRDDFLALSAPYPLDTTVITWRAVDLNGNGTSRTQLVVVTDNEKPHLEVQPNDTITACDISGHFLRIPATSDNSNLLDTLFYSVVGSSYNFRDTLINNFDPNGDGTTDPIPDLTAESNYTVTWRVVDHSGMDSVMFYTLHVEVRPEIIMPDGIMTSNLACGGTNTGSIIIDSYNSEPGQNVEFTIDAWSAYIQSTAILGASANTFSNLPGRDDYGVQIRVNDCYSLPVYTVQITEPDEYFLSGTIVMPYCAEDDSGSIAPIVEGGVDGQFYLGGGSISVPDYNELDLIGSGTMEAWVYMRDGSANAGTNLISKAGAYEVSIDASGHLAMSADGSGFSTGYTPKQDSWFHVAASWSGGSGSIYVDGALVGSGSVGTPSANGSTLDVGGAFNGVIREVRIWSSDWSTIGDQKNTKYEGNETFPGGYRIVCYLPLENISGGTTLNRSNTSANGSVSGAAWAPTPAYPQPGTYEWTSNVGYSNSNDSISISNLKAGEYTLTFYDIYGCPGGVGLTHLFILQAEDHTPPAISSPLNVPVLEADDDCGHIITNAEELTLLPVINSNNDGHNCDYTFSWQVYSQATGNTTPKTTSLVGANLGIGTNTIYVEVEQNGYTNTFNYNVTVADSLEPTPRATLPTGIQLNSTVGGGSVTVAAEVFNNKVTTSDDNCTPDNLLRYKVSRNSQPFTDSITFTCADITTPVDVTLRVYDLNNNFADVTQNGVTVRDTVDPVFLKDALLIDGNCAVAEDAGGVGNLTHVPNLELIPGTHYGDNCSVSQIYYRIVNTDYPTYSDAGYTPLNAWVDLYNSVFHEGTSEVWFYLVDASGNTSISKVMFNVEVLDMPNPTGFGGN